jgi:hypothetical protein
VASAAFSPTISATCGSVGVDDRWYEGSVKAKGTQLGHTGGRHPYKGGANKAARDIRVTHRDAQRAASL